MHAECITSVTVTIMYRVLQKVIVQIFKQPLIIVDETYAIMFSVDVAVNCQILFNYLEM